MRFDNPYQELRNMKEEDEKLYNWLLYSLNSIRRSKRDWVDIDLSNYFTLFIESWKPILLRKLIHIDLQLINMDGTVIKGFEMDLDSIFCNSAKRIYFLEIKTVRGITSFLGNELATVQFAVVCITLPVRVTLTDANIVKYNRQKEK